MFSFFSFLSFLSSSSSSSSFRSHSSSGLIILIISSSHAHSLSISFPSLSTSSTNYNPINYELINNEIRNITHCMNCICTITTNCIPPSEQKKCTERIEPNPRRCGMFRISSADHSDWKVDERMEKSFGSCADDINCVEGLILDKKPRCEKNNSSQKNAEKMGDSCLDHARDVFVGMDSDCEKTSPEFDEFLRCYDPSFIQVTDVPEVTVTDTTSITNFTESSSTDRRENETPRSMKEQEYSGNESRLYIMFYGLTGSILVVVLLSIVVLSSFCFRSKKAPKSYGATKEIPKNIGAKESYRKGRENRRDKAMAINQEYFTRYANRGNGDQINYTNEDDGSSGFDECSSPMDSPGLASSDRSREAIPMELNVGSLNAMGTQPPHVFFRHHLSRIEPLKVASGVGHFGSISSAIYTNEFGNIQKVAIKSLIRYDFSKLVEEAQIACLMDHPHVLKLLGILIENETLKLVFPFMENADLGHYLRTEKDKVTPMQLRSFSLEVASGMEYLASKKVVHRDLAARNCMLDSNLHIKVADFGLSRKINPENCHHRIAQTSVIPQSSAPECFDPEGKITEKTDVWAFGVTLWEIFNHAQNPPLMVQNDGSIIAHAPQKKCPIKIYDLMKRCWEYDQNWRPKFSAIYRYLSNLQYRDFVHLPTAKHRIAGSEHAQTYVRNDGGDILPMYQMTGVDENKTIEMIEDRTEKRTIENRVLDPRGYVSNVPEYSDPEELSSYF